jgi:hypothetical protein
MQPRRYFDINELRPYTMDKQIMLDYLEEGSIRLGAADLRDFDMPLTLYVMICYSSSWVWHKQRRDVYDADYVDVIACTHPSEDSKSNRARLSGNIRRIMVRSKRKYLKANLRTPGVGRL